jgi:hypothetical protein
MFAFLSSLARHLGSSVSGAVDGKELAKVLPALFPNGMEGITLSVLQCAVETRKLSHDNQR